MAGDLDFTEQRIDGETVCDAGFMRMVRDRVRMHNGKEATRYVLRHCGAAAVLARFEDDSLLLVRQFRYALGRHTLEIPAGKIDAGDEPLATAQRELREETGYVADDWQQIMHCHSSTGFTDETLTVFDACGLRLEGPPAPDEHEHLQVVRISLADAWKLKQAGEITEARTLYALLWLRCRSDERL
ncbi:MAG: NUDIX hydrolase [Betaproteobacteria bacterium]|nr:NUDIX hydrolase [Betaproteobacteria bacterium]